MLNIKSPTPCLFYPIAKEMGITTKQLLANSQTQKEALLAIAKKYPAGAVVRMTELWCEAASFGMEISFADNDFPKLGTALFDEADDFEDISAPSAVNDITSPLIEAISLAKPLMDKPLFVGVTAPYTLASVLNGSENFMINTMTEPELCSGFLQKLTDFLVHYINEYKKAGADGVMLCDPSISMISPDMTNEFANIYNEKIISTLQTDTFSIIYHNCGAVNPHLEAIAKLSARGFHFGSDVDIKKAIDIIPKDRIVMGNVDPRLFLPSSSSKGKIDALKDEMSGYDNFVLSTGCDLSPNATNENISLFF